MERVNLFINQSIIRFLAISLIVAGFFSFLALNYFDWQLIFAIDLGVLSILFFLRFPLVGLYAMSFLMPFWGWKFVYGGIDVPYVDMIGLALFVAVALRTLIVWIHKMSGEEIDDVYYLKYFPAWPLFLGFFVVAALSITQSQEPLISLKYLFRPLMFFYLVYVLLPVNLIITKQIFKTVLFFILTSSLVVAALALLNVLFGYGSWFMRRAQPMPIFGLNILGGNHNAVAEIMIIVLPIALLLYLFSQKIKNKGWYILIMFFFLLTLLLTFSRSGWLALILQVAVLYFLQFKNKFNKQTILASIVLVLIILSSFYVFVWSQVGQVQGSTSSRWLMTQVALSKFIESPVIGHGLNTFDGIISGTFVYWVEFADPLDAHGVVQKLITETGALGLMTFFAIWFYVLLVLYRSYKSSDDFEKKAVFLCLFVLISSIMFFQLFSTSYYIAKTWLPIGLALAGVNLYFGPKNLKIIAK